MTSFNSDTPGKDGHFEKQKLELVPMERKKLSIRGRPSKGPRHSFIVKLDLPRAQKLREIIEILDTDGVTLLSPLVADYVDSVDVRTLRNQEGLPIDKAS